MQHWRHRCRSLRSRNFTRQRGKFCALAGFSRGSPESATTSMWMCAARWVAVRRHDCGACQTCMTRCSSLVRQPRALRSQVFDSVAAKCRGMLAHGIAQQLRARAGLGTQSGAASDLCAAAEEVGCAHVTLGALARHHLAGLRTSTGQALASLAALEPAFAPVLAPLATPQGSATVGAVAHLRRSDAAEGASAGMPVVDTLATLMNHGAEVVQGAQVHTQGALASQRALVGATAWAASAVAVALLRAFETVRAEGRRCPIHAP